jgi:uncharacterized membrane protein YedE/YeeE
MNTLFSYLIILLAGLLFGVGLAISGMNDTHVVQGFLDVFGQWDSRLIFVMLAALIITLLTFPLILKRQKPIFDSLFHLPKFSQIDRKLIIGAAMFGIGWGLVGYCPGPAIASISYGYWQTAVFIVSMLIGAFICNKTTS